MSSLIKITNAGFRKHTYQVFEHTDWELSNEDNWAIVGANGSGKTTFLEILENKLTKINGELIYNFADTDNGNVSQYIASVYFKDPSIRYSDFYYQQRYNASETDNIVTVRDFLQPNGVNDLSELQNLNIAHLLDMEIIKLSNGQSKKMLIAKALMKKPRLLLLDNLYTGLDSQARNYIADTINQIAMRGTNLVIVADESIPTSINKIMEIDRFAIKKISNVRNYIPSSRYRYHDLPLLPKAPTATFNIVARLENVNVIYNNRRVINQVDWTILNGEKWALTGPNGSGKSMLLSLIFADNPQAYSNTIVLFDRERGTGESIWDIKEQIGFVSPEMHLYFARNSTCREIALSSLYENPYNRRQISDEIVKLIDDLFDYFSIQTILDNRFQHVSTGQQNIILLIRALVKNPPVLILDEPFQGIDADSIRLAKSLLDEYCNNRTLIFVSHQPEELPSCVTKFMKLDFAPSAFDTSLLTQVTQD
jgi:molybdate transport system ATP-binding protein